MYLRRHLSDTLRKAMEQFPAVLVTGPRQAGKTTLLQHEMGETSGYVSFDDPVERSFALADPNGFLDRFGDRPVILDEIQYAPELLSSLKLRIDKDRRRNGRWREFGGQDTKLVLYTVTGTPVDFVRVGSWCDCRPGCLHEGWQVKTRAKEMYPDLFFSHFRRIVG